MSHKDKKVKRIVINASAAKSLFNSSQIKKKDDVNNQLPKGNPIPNTKLLLSHKQMETSSYRLSRVRDNLFNNRYVETENKESFCSSFFRENPEMLDMRPPSIKILEYYEKLGICVDSNSIRTKVLSQNNSKNKKMIYDNKYNPSDNFSYISMQPELTSNFTRKEKIKLLAQVIPLELIVHGKNSFELLRAHIMIAHFYNRVRKSHPAIRHLNEAQKIQNNTIIALNSKKSSKPSNVSPSKSSRLSRRASQSALGSQKMPIKAYDQQSVMKNDDYCQNDEIKREIDDEISIEFSNAYLILAMDNFVPASAKSKYINNAIISLSRFNEESKDTNDGYQLSARLLLRKDLAEARLLFVQKKYEDSARYYENVLESIANASNSIDVEDESKNITNNKSFIRNQNIKDDLKSSNELIRLDELEELADIKMEAAENIKMIIKSEINSLKLSIQKVRSIKDDNIHYENLIDDIDYALDLYCEARDSYEDAGLEDNAEECDIYIQKLENERDEVYQILEQENQQRQRFIKEINEENQEKIQNLEKDNKGIKKVEKVERKFIAESTIEVKFDSSSSFGENEDNVETIVIRTNSSKSIKNDDNDSLPNKPKENKLDANLLVPLLGNNDKKNSSSSNFALIQAEGEFGSDENEDEIKNREFRNENIKKNESDKLEVIKMTHKEPEHKESKINNDEEINKNTEIEDNEDEMGKNNEDT